MHRSTQPVSGPDQRLFIVSSFVRCQSSNKSRTPSRSKVEWQTMAHVIRETDDHAKRPVFVGLKSPAYLEMRYDELSV